MVKLVLLSTVLLCFAYLLGSGLQPFSSQNVSGHCLRPSRSGPRDNLHQLSLQSSNRLCTSQKLCKLSLDI